jgi:hypothetical protein
MNRVRSAASRLFPIHRPRRRRSERRFKLCKTPRCMWGTRTSRREIQTVVKRKSTPTTPTSQYSLWRKAMSVSPRRCVHTYAVFVHLTIPEKTPQPPVLLVLKRTRRRRSAFPIALAWHALKGSTQLSYFWTSAGYSSTHVSFVTLTTEYR